MLHSRSNRAYHSFYEPSPSGGGASLRRSLCLGRGEQTLAPIARISALHDRLLEWGLFALALLIPMTQPVLTESDVRTRLDGAPHNGLSLAHKVRRTL